MQVRSLDQSDFQFTPIESIEPRPEKVRRLEMKKRGDGRQFILPAGRLSGDAAGGRCGLLSAKGGLMMGTKKVGAFSSPRKKANFIIA
jgi:hypothetical protein